MRDALRQRPGERTMRWVAESIGVGSRVASLRRLTLGGWHVNHAVTVIDRHANAHRLVLRRWARPDWAVEDPYLTAGRERAVLELLATSTVPAPRLVSADPDAIVCDVPALLISRLPGRPRDYPPTWAVSSPSSPRRCSRSTRSTRMLANLSRGTGRITI